MTRPYLGNPKYTIEVLQKYGFVFQKRFGQNFLIDTRVLDRIIEASEITKDDFVLEIGPGIGTMTQYLADAAREVTAVEIDDALIPILQDTLKEWDNVSVIHGDILKTDIKRIADEKNNGRPIKVVANLPYYITTPIVEASLDIDFDILHTEMCTADSLLQRMGRCNRKGRYFPEEANIFIYDNRNGVGKNCIYDPVMYDRSLDLLAQYENLEFVERMKTTYMNQVYDPDKIKKTSYYEEIEDCLQRLSKIHPVDYKLKEAEIRKIDSVTVVPEDIYQEKMDLFEYGTDFLRKSNISKETKSLIRSKLEELTLSIGIYNKYPEEIDRTSIGFKNYKSVTDIYRTEYKYDFEPETGKGAGLLTSEILEQNGIFV